MKQKTVDILSPLLVGLLRMTLRRMKPFFLSENEVLKEELCRQGFHPALCNHPSILFGEREEGKVKALFLKLEVAYLKKCIKIGLLKGEKGQELMLKLGMQPYFGNGVVFWFEESHSPMVPYIIPDNPKPKGRTVVYTALTGNYDEVHEILYKEKDVDYLLFTNNSSVKSKTWQVKLVKSDLDNVLLSREIKMFPQKYLGDGYESSIYIDANVLIYGELSELTRYLGRGKAFAVSRHGERASVKDEVEAVVRIVGVDKKHAEEQYEHYVEEGFVDNIGLAECNILVRSHNQQPVVELMKFWWNEFKSGVKRDQLSLIPCIQKSNFKELAWMEGGYTRHNQFCRVIGHKSN